MRTLREVIHELSNKLTLVQYKTIKITNAVNIDKSKDIEDLSQNARFSVELLKELREIAHNLEKNKVS